MKKLKFMSKEESVQLDEKDYLTLPEISKRAVAQIRPDMLYRTHTALHTEAKGDVGSKKLVSAHKRVADEIKARGFMHHDWDKLDSSYQQ